jgi:hypothetical protein
MSRLYENIEAVDKRGDNGICPPVLIVGRREEAIFFIDQDLIEIFPVSPVDAVQDHTLFGLRQTVYFVHDLYRDLGKVAPYHPFRSLVELTEMGSADNLFFCLLGMPGDLTSPDNPQGIAVEDGANVLRRGGLPQARLSHDEFFAPIEPGEETKKKGRIEIFALYLYIGSIKIEVVANIIVYPSDPCLVMAVLH